ncbi:hypothetical protein D3C80_1676260 [compost metagenome]
MVGYTGAIPAPAMAKRIAPGSPVTMAATVHMDVKPESIMSDSVKPILSVTGPINRRASVKQRKNADSMRAADSVLQL